MKVIDEKVYTVVLHANKKKIHFGNQSAANAFAKRSKENNISCSFLVDSINYTIFDSVKEYDNNNVNAVALNILCNLSVDEINALNLYFTNANQEE